MSAPNDAFRKGPGFHSPSPLVIRGQRDADALRAFLAKQRRLFDDEAVDALDSERLAAVSTTGRHRAEAAS